MTLGLESYCDAVAKSFGNPTGPACPFHRDRNGGSKERKGFLEAASRSSTLGRFWFPNVQRLLLPTGFFYPKLSVTLHVLCGQNKFCPMVMVTHRDARWSRGSEF